MTNPTRENVMMRAPQSIYLYMILEILALELARQEAIWGSSNFDYSLAMASLILGAHWLYWRWTGLRYSRSLGQRMFGIAVLAEDGSAMTSKMWDQRARRKLIFLIPILNIIQGIRELARISQRHTHQSNIDLHVGSIVAHADSLPPANRKHIK